MYLLPSEELTVCREEFSAFEQILILVSAAFSCIFRSSVHCRFEDVNIQITFESCDQVV